MANPRKKAKRKTNIKYGQCSPPKAAPRKRRATENMAKPEQSSAESKRRRTHAYNLRETNSVILVGEIPCCQSAEQREKYSKLGLNSALFVKGSQRPKRKQSHISIITISSDDEETSEERTSEWVKSLDQHYSSVEPEQESADENTEREPTFNLLSSRILKPSRTTVLCGSDGVGEIEEGGDRVEESMDCEPTASAEVPRSESRPPQDASGDFQVTISVPGNLTECYQMKYDAGETENLENSDGFISASNNKVEQSNANSTGFSIFQSSGSNIGTDSSNQASKNPFNELSQSRQFFFGPLARIMDLVPMQTNTDMCITKNNLRIASTTSLEGGGESNEVGEYDSSNNSSMKCASNKDSNSLQSEDPEALSRGDSCNKLSGHTENQ